MKILFVIKELGLMDNAAISMLSAVARDLGHQRYACVLKNEPLAAKIKEVQPDIIAYSVNSCDAQYVFKVHNEVAKPTGIFSVMGGAHATLYPDSLKESGMDACCIGEGEGAFGDVLKARELGQPLDDIPNIHTLKNQNPPRPLADLASLPMPDRDLLLNGFLSNFPRKTFLTSRGCPYGCTYCFNAALKQIYVGKGKWVRRFSVDRVIEEIKAVRASHKLEFVKFDDDNFALRPDEWLEEFANRYSKEVGLPFNCLMRLDSASDRMLDLLKKAGCHSITTSVDSASQRIREQILERTTANPMNNKAIQDAMLRVHDHGIKLFVNYITAIPTSTAADEMETIRLSKAGKVTYSNYTALVPFFGTEIWNYCKANGFYEETAVPESLLRATALKGFTPQEVRVQRNVLLLGAYQHVVPQLFMGTFLKFIKSSPPNRAFTVLYSFLKSWLVSTKIYPNKSSLVDKLRVTIKATKSDLWQVDG